LLPLTSFLKYISSKVFILSVMAASLGQVYKGRLKENGDQVAVKVQRPFVLETVTVDLFVIRNLGLVLRRFPQVMFHRSDL
jgi:aarF domain-containing kinase